jgi:hypothetical protein
MLNYSEMTDEQLTNIARALEAQRATNGKLHLEASNQVLSDVYAEMAKRARAEDAARPTPSWYLPENKALAK